MADITFEQVKSLIEQMPDDGRADETGPSGYEYNCAVVTHDRALMLLDSSAKER